MPDVLDSTLSGTINVNIPDTGVFQGVNLVLPATPISLNTPFDVVFDIVNHRVTPNETGHYQVEVDGVVEQDVPFSIAPGQTLTANKVTLSGITQAQVQSGNVVTITVNIFRNTA